MVRHAVQMVEPLIGVITLGPLNSQLDGVWPQCGGKTLLFCELHAIAVLMALLLLHPVFVPFTRPSVKLGAPALRRAIEQLPGGL
jgi:hypothetical protein